MEAVQNKDNKQDSLYRKYMRVMGRIGDIQGRGILTILYMTIFAIPGVSMSAFGDRLKMKKPPSSWLDRPAEEVTIERARDQW